MKRFKIVLIYSLICILVCGCGKNSFPNNSIHQNGSIGNAKNSANSNSQAETPESTASDELKPEESQTNSVNHGGQDNSDNKHEGHDHKNTEQEGDEKQADCNVSGTSDTLTGLKGKIICIDAGHGNPDIKGKQEKIAPNSDITKPGTVYGAVGVVTKTPEYKINMQVSVKLKQLLEAEGCTVIMTRQSDEENPGNIERAVTGNSAGSHLVVRIHADSSTNRQAHGISVLYPGDKYISDSDMIAQSKKAAQYVHDAVVKATDAHPRGIVDRDDLTGFNWSERPVILVEMGFLSNPEEDKLLNDPSYQDKIAAGIAEGIENYFEIN